MAALHALCGNAPARAQAAVEILGRVLGPHGPLPTDATVHVGFRANGARPADAGHPDSSSAVPGDDGRFMVCNAHRGQTLFLSVARRDSLIADTVVAVREGPAQYVDWTATPGHIGHFAVGTLAGYVHLDTTAKPVPGASVSIDALDRVVVAGDDGSFLLSNLPVGRYAVQVRGLGLPVVDDSVAVTANATVHRTFVMHLALGRAHGIAGVDEDTALESGRLKAFETRAREHRSGYFVTASQLRANDNQSLPGVLRRFFPGIVSSYYWGRNLLESNRGIATIEALPARSRATRSAHAGAG